MICWPTLADLDFVRIGDVARSGNVGIVVVAPAISLASGAANYPVTVTLTDPGHPSGPQPLGDTSSFQVVGCSY